MKRTVDPAATTIKTPEQALTYLLGKERVGQTRKICGNISRQAVSQWRKSKQIPAQHCVRLEYEFGVPREAMRPDVFYTL